MKETGALHMEFIQKIRALQIGKRKTFRRVLLVEILLMLLGIVGLFGRNEVYEYPSEGVTVNTGVYQDNMTIEHISLKPGLYRIQLHYDTDTNMKNFCIIEDDTVRYRMLRNSGEHLYQGLHETDYRSRIIYVLLLPTVEKGAIRSRDLPFGKPTVWQSFSCLVLWCSPFWGICYIFMCSTTESIRYLFRRREFISVWYFFCCSVLCLCCRMPCCPVETWDTICFV